MLDTGSNTTLLSKHAAKQLGLAGTSTHLTMNLAGGKRKSEQSEVFEVSAVSPVDEDVEKTFVVHTVKKPCSNAKAVPKKAIDRYPHLKTLSEKIFLSGGPVDLLIGTDFVDAFIDIHSLWQTWGTSSKKKLIWLVPLRSS